uniref:Uncharacterized protein n=1 Tax=Knipowitschia caucasica TaxID=637954 RepID=A0AAV2MKI7_KNICA
MWRPVNSPVPHRGWVPLCLGHLHLENTEMGSQSPLNRPPLTLWSDDESKCSCTLKEGCLPKRRERRASESVCYMPAYNCSAPPRSMVTARRNNNQLEGGFMDKWTIPRRPHFPRFSLFS